MLVGNIHAEGVNSFNRTFMELKSVDGGLVMSQQFVLIVPLWNRNKTET